MKRTKNFYIPISIVWGFLVLFSVGMLALPWMNYLPTFFEKQSLQWIQNRDREQSDLGIASVGSLVKGVSQKVKIWSQFLYAQYLGKTPWDHPLIQKFKEDPDIFALAVLSKNQKDWELVGQVFQEEGQVEAQAAKKVPKWVMQLPSSAFDAAENGAMHLAVGRLDNNQQVLLLILPEEVSQNKKTKSQVLSVAAISPDYLNQSLGAISDSRLILINREGVLLHASAKWLAGSSFRSLPTVTRALTAATAAGSWVEEENKEAKVITFRSLEGGMLYWVLSSPVPSFLAKSDFLTWPWMSFGILICALFGLAALVTHHHYKNFKKYREIFEMEGLLEAPHYFGIWGEWKVFQEWMLAWRSQKKEEWSKAATPQVPELNLSQEIKREISNLEKLGPEWFRKKLCVLVKIEADAPAGFEGQIPIVDEAVWKNLRQLGGTQKPHAERIAPNILCYSWFAEPNLALFEGSMEFSKTLKTELEQWNVLCEFQNQPKIKWHTLFMLSDVQTFKKLKEQFEIKLPVNTLQVALGIFRKMEEGGLSSSSTLFQETVYEVVAEKFLFDLKNVFEINESPNSIQYFFKLQDENQSQPEAA